MYIYHERRVIHAASELSVLKIFDAFLVSYISIDNDHNAMVICRPQQLN